MYQTGHQGAGLLFAAPFAFIGALIFPSDVLVLGGLLVIGLASAPDLDMRVPLISHRGITHTVWAAAAVGVVMAIVAGVVGFGSNGLIGAVTYALFGGLLAAATILSHIAADALTPMGIKPFTPVNSFTFSLSLVKAANPIANYALLIIGGGICLLSAVAGIWVRSAVAGIV